MGLSEIVIKRIEQENSSLEKLKKTIENRSFKNIDEMLGMFLNEIDELKEFLWLKERLCLEENEMRKYNVDWKVIKSSKFILNYEQFSEVIARVMSGIEEEEFIIVKYPYKKVVRGEYEPYEENVYDICIADLDIIRNKLDAVYRECWNSRYADREKYNDEDWFYLHHEKLSHWIRNSTDSTIVKNASACMYNVSYYDYEKEVGNVIFGFDVMQKMCVRWSIDIKSPFVYIYDFLKFITLKQYQKEKNFTFAEMLLLADEFVDTMSKSLSSNPNQKTKTIIPTN